MANNFKQVNSHVIQGDGAPANGDGLCVNLSAFPIGSIYTDSETGILYVRNSADGDADDWVSNSGGGIQSATVELTDAQIKALPTTGVQVVAAPGEGKAIIPLAATILLDASAGVYTNITDASLLLMNPAGPYLSSVMKFEQILGSETPQFNQFVIPHSFVGSGVFADTVVTAQTASIAQMNNSAINIKDDWGGVTDYTGGNAANTLKVTVYYVVVDL